MKRYLLTASKMKQYDTNTIQEFKMPSLLLMERAALSTVEELQKERGNRPCRVLVVSGCGNNGGDGLAIGRLLMLQGYAVDFVLLGSLDRQSVETRKQTEILTAYGASFFDRIEGIEYSIIVDAIFGIGLTREVSGEYRDAVEQINRSKAYVCSVDIPSGINADDGAVMGCAVKADLTVTYGFYKIGQMLYPGTEYCGRIVCRDIGIDERSFLGESPVWYTYDKTAGIPMPKRRADGNKGTFGKVLIIAGSSTICGAAMLCARSCFRIGAGMVKVVTAQENREALQQCVPEAMLTIYREDMTDEERRVFDKALEEDMAWADCILIGPGTGTKKTAMRMLERCIEESGLPLVIDADGLNLLAADKGLQKNLSERAGKERPVILTPHMGEFARLYGCDTKQAKENITDYPQKLADRLRCTVVCKDARTVVAGYDMKEQYLNITGNAGMATAGSGDVLAGMAAGLLAQGKEAGTAAVAGVFLHGMAGDLAAKRKTEYSLMATDIIEEIENAVMEANDRTEREISDSCERYGSYI